MIHAEITEIIIGSFYEVYNTLGFGFLEKVYENALYLELASQGLDCKRQHPVEVFYRDTRVGSYFTDLMVEDKVIVELKAKETLSEAHSFQLINYLRATDIEVGLLLNFGRSPEFKRKVFMNINKKILHPPFSPQP